MREVLLCALVLPLNGLVSKECMIVSVSIITTFAAIYGMGELSFFPLSNGKLPLARLS